MKRWSAFVAGMLTVVSVALVGAASIPPNGPKPLVEKKPDAEKQPVVIGHKTAVFNMAAVMRDFHQAKYQVHLLNVKKDELSKKLLGWRTEYIDLQTKLKDNPNHPKKDAMTKQMVALSRQIEDEDKEIAKQLNDDASAIIVNLYDMIKTVVDKTAERDGFQLVLAYPDAVTPEELKSGYIKELKLKPPAAQPFYVAPDIDITARVIQSLNDKHPPLDPKTKQPVDVSKLSVPLPGAAPMGGAPRP